MLPLLTYFNNDFSKGTLSSLISSTITYPMDVVKTNFQIARFNNNNSSTVEIIKQIYKNKGLIGFTKGISSNWMTYPIFWGVFFQTQTSSSLYIDNSLVKSMTASTTASTIANPLFVLKVRFQANPNNLTYGRIVKDIYIKEGFTGYFKGLPSTIINNSKLWIQFPLYDLIKKHTENVIYASLGSKIISSMIYYPTDLIRINQRANVNKITIVEAVKNIYEKQGIKGFYKGFWLYNAVSVPSFIILMVVKEYFDSQTK